jgi:hypothetical protein
VAEGKAISHAKGIRNKTYGQIGAIKKVFYE